MPRAFATRLAWIALLALAVRLVWALVVMRHAPVTGDGNEFHGLARELADHGRYSEPGTSIATAEKPPLYPLVLALPAKLGIGTVTADRALSCLLGTGTVVAIGALGRRVAGARVGLVAALVAAVYPALFALDSTLRSESLYALLIALSLLAAYRAVERRSGWSAVLLGLAIGAAALTRGEAILLLLALVVPAVLLVPRGARLRLGLLALAGCAALVLPWLARNWIVFDRPAAISTNEGGLLAGANCPRAYYGDEIGWWACLPRLDPAWGRNEAVISSHWQSQAVRYARRHGGRLPAVAAARLGRTWGLYRPRQQSLLEGYFADRNVDEQHAGLAVYWLLLVLAIGGALVLRARGDPLRLLLAPVALVVFVTATTYGSFRFRVAADVSIAVLAAVAIVALRDRLLAARWRTGGSMLAPWSGRTSRSASSS